VCTFECDHKVNANTLNLHHLTPAKFSQIILAKTPSPNGEGEKTCAFINTKCFCNQTKVLGFVFLVLISCGKPLPAFDDFNLEKWRNDKNGCRGERALNLKSLTSQKDKLKGLSQDAIVKLLGRPDQNELYKRNQKFFHYLLTPGKECGTDSTSLKLSLRFNAMGFAKEVVVE